MKISTHKLLSATQRTAVEDECERRNVQCEIKDRGAWIAIKMTGETDEVVAAWAAIRHATFPGVS